MPAWGSLFFFSFFVFEYGLTRPNSHKTSWADRGVIPFSLLFDNQISKCHPLMQQSQLHCRSFVMPRKKKENSESFGIGFGSMSSLFKVPIAFVVSTKHLPCFNVWSYGSLKPRPQKKNSFWPTNIIKGSFAIQLSISYDNKDVVLWFNCLEFKSGYIRPMYKKKSLTTHETTKSFLRTRFLDIFKRDGHSGISFVALVLSSPSPFPLSRQNEQLTTLLQLWKPAFTL